MPGTSRSIGCVSDRKDLRHMEALLRPAAHAMARPCKASIQVRLTAIAYNLKRTLSIITAEERDFRRTKAESAISASNGALRRLRKAKTRPYSTKTQPAHRSHDSLIRSMLIWTSLACRSTAAIASAQPP